MITSRSKELAVSAIGDIVQQVHLIFKLNFNYFTKIHLKYQVTEFLSTDHRHSPAGSFVSFTSRFMMYNCTQVNSWTVNSIHLIYFASIAELKQLPAGSSAAFALDNWGIDSSPSPTSSSTAGSFAAIATAGLSSAGAHDFFRN